MILAIALYLIVGFVWGCLYAIDQSETDETGRDVIETGIGAFALLVAWPVFAAIKAWRAFR